MTTPSSVPVIAISGASAGIGLAIAEHFAAQSWHVSISSRTQDDLLNLEKRWATDYPESQLHTISLDMAQPAAAEVWAEAIQERFGRLDVLVHNLGQFQPGTLLGGEVEQLTNLINTNLLSAHYLTRAMLPFLKQAETANMITIGSVATTDWPAPLAAYSISKYALEGWHRAIQKELLQYRVQTTLIRPGATYTRSWEGVEVDPKTLLQPAQIARLVTQTVLGSAAAHLDEITIRPEANG